MNLSDKLHRFAAEKPPQVIPEQPSDLTETLQGVEVVNELGSYYVVENRYPLDYIHGGLPLGKALECKGANLAWLAKDDALNHLSLERTLFLDTETTGLAGGAGTVAFLIGVGFFQEDSFVVRQYFMRDYHEEAAMLLDFQALLAEYQALVTFNGKSFDWPLIKDRLIMARFRPAVGHYLHLDLLHSARRLYRAKLATCSLDSLETHILHVHRENDIPGYEVPQRYFAYLQSKRGELVTDIFIHNRLDVMSMVSLVSYFQALVTRKLDQLDCPYECLALARIYEQKKQWPEAIRHYQRVIELGGPVLCCTISLNRLGLIYRRQAQWNLAESIWQVLVDEMRDVQSCEELAKYYEHVCKDYAKAHRVAKLGLRLAQAKDKIKVQEFEYRLQRLERKINKAIGGL